MVPGAQAGGKILKRRLNAAMNTPYDRPIRPLPSALQPQSPSWLSELVLFAKFIAGGTIKIFSPIWNPSAWALSSSSSSSEDGVEVDYEDNEHPSDGFVELNQKKRSSSGKRENLHLIEQLLLREQFSREEYDRLIGIIKSQVDAGPSNIWRGTDNDISDICSQAIMEANKWIAEKKVGSCSKPDMDAIESSCSENKI